MRKIFAGLALAALLLAKKVEVAVAQTPLSIYASSAPVNSCTREHVLTAVHACFLSADQGTCINQMLSSCSTVDPRVEKLRAFFVKYNSPLVDSADEFVKYADQYNIDWRLVPAISGVESTFGKHMPKNSYNAYGWANGAYKFTSWDNSIQHVTMTLRTKYYDRGYDTLPEISRIYCPPNPLWWTKVKYFMDKIDKTEVASAKPDLVATLSSGI